MALTGSGLAAHLDFLDQAEAFRYRFVQTLNRMQAELIPHVGGEDPRISAENWKRVPRFTYRALNPLIADKSTIRWSLMVLLGWLAGLGLLATLAGRRVEGIAR
jgi:ABC-2 type transport system permease protein